MLGISEDNFKNLEKGSRKRNLKNVSFNEDEIVINPEDVDPNVGRFRNLIQSTVVPTKKTRLDTSQSVSSASPNPSATSHTDLLLKQFNASLIPHLYQDLPPTSNSADAAKYTADADAGPLSIGSKLGLVLPNPAPDVAPICETPVNPAPKQMQMHPPALRVEDELEDLPGDEPRKKKYAKEAWPGRKPLLSGL